MFNPSNIFIALSGLETELSGLITAIFGLVMVLSGLEVELATTGCIQNVALLFIANESFDVLGGVVHAVVFIKEMSMV
eukprot:CAMPEP_0194374718 /NCGR_PEP_ID=MMETSP0174-20130528/23165_1 /TAXON_ID=216777 /ORGANISM="Proboscia alata, Strain PI-D3" /LENGTH=77 /DNA_ID=CAMNT_0039154457 /DNA_START=521 /DNA_END=754 /DNA_ORIENTATION=+